MNIAETSTDAPRLTWFKSSHSGTQGGQCVEVAASTGVVHVRDSKTATGPVLRVSPHAWADFVNVASSERNA
ncbi:DUF397 domain-containing protein [Streptomyces sp. NPDC127068]|uniref:DUF397 domain-containing protein n=1 Tax=Streptomyces sp. NPDC127068 TaxID=3347127 RepID=UPI003646F0C5